MTWAALGVAAVFTGAPRQPILHRGSRFCIYLLAWAGAAARATTPAIIAYLLAFAFGRECFSFWPVVANFCSENGSS